MLINKPDTVGVNISKYWHKWSFWLYRVSITNIKFFTPLIKPNQGDLLIHSGLVKHGGNKIISGTRYLLVGFLDVKSKYINPSYLSINHNLEDSYVLNLIWKPIFFNNQIIKIKNKPYCAKIIDMFYEKDKVLIEYNSKELIINFSEIIYK